MTASFRAQLMAGAAVASSMVIATPALAECDIDGDTVTCDADAESDEVNDALDTLPGPAGALVIADGVTISAVGPYVGPQAPPIVGAFTITNSGTIGSEDDPLGIYFQPPDGTPQPETSFNVYNVGALIGDIEANAGTSALLENAGSIIGDIAMTAGVQTGDTETQILEETTILDDGSVQSDQFTTTTSRTSFTPGIAELVNGDTGIIEGNVGLSGSDQVLLSTSGLIDGPAVLSSAYQELLQQDTTLARTTRTPEGGEGYSFVSVSNETRSTNIGGDITAIVGPGGVITGGLTVFTNAGSANVEINGDIGTADTLAGLTIVASGIDTLDSFGTDPDDGSRSERSEETATGGTADLSIGSEGRISGDVSVNAQGGITFDGNGTIGGDLQLTSIAAPTTRTEAMEFSANAVDGGSQSVEARTSTFDTAAVGGNIDAGIGSDATVGGNVGATGAGTIALVLEGSVLGDIDLQSQANDQTNETIRTVTTTTSEMAGEDDRVVVQTSETSLTRNTPVGGSIVGRYDGTIGAPEGDESARDVAVTQIAAGGSSASIGGTIYGSFEGKAEAVASIILEASDIIEAAGGGMLATRQEETQKATNITHQQADSAVLLTGSVLPNGQGDGNVEVIAAMGDASLQVQGGMVEGDVAVAGGTGRNGSESESRFEVFEAEDPTEEPPALFRTETIAESSFAAGGTASLMLEGGSIEGNAYVLGVGNGEGSIGANVSIDAQSRIGGTLFIANAEDQDEGFVTFEQASDTRMRDEGGLVSRTVTELEEYTPSEFASDIVADVQGGVGGILARAILGDVTVRLGGTSDGDITLASGALVTGRLETTTYSGDDPESLEAETVLTQDKHEISSVYGGTASLTIAAAVDGGATIETGNIRIAGANNSVLTVESGAIVLPMGGVIAIGETLPEMDDTDGESDPSHSGIVSGSDSETEGSQSSSTSGDPEEGEETVSTQESVTRTIEQSSGSSIATSGNFSDFSNTTTVTAETYRDGKVVTSRTDLTQTRNTNFAVFSNSGTVGSTTAPVTIRVSGVGTGENAVLDTAMIANSGAIYGDITVNAIGSQGSVSSMSDNSDPENSQTSFSITREALASGAAIENSGLIAGTVALQAGSGTFANTGIVRGNIDLGAAFPNLITLSLDQEALDALAEADEDAPPPTIEQIRALITTELDPSLLEQTYRFQQNGLATGTISIGEIAKLGFAGFLPDGTRTSQINANILLGENSVTLGSIAGETAAATGDGAPERLTSTTVSLTGSGFLGAGNDDMPAAAIGGNYLLTPDFAAFVALDPTLLDDPESLESGTRVTGVDTIEKTGTGTFTIVAAPSAQGSFAFDIGALDILEGDIQLGVVGDDAFAMRGDVTNNGGLWLGRAIGDVEGLTGIEGITFDLTGSYQQGDEGRLYVPINASIATTPGSTSAFLNVTGDANLAGEIALANQIGVYFGGERVDFLTVGGTFTATDLGVTPLNNSPFLEYSLSTTQQSDGTLVGIEVLRTPYASAATNANEVAVANAFQDALGSLQSATDIAEGSMLAALRDSVIALDFGGQDISEQFGAVGTAASYGSILSLSALDGFSPLGSAGLGMGSGASPVAQRDAGNDARFTSRRYTYPVDQSGAALSALSGGGDGGTRLSAWAMPSFGTQTRDANFALGTSRVESDHSGIIGGFELATEGGDRFGLGIGYDDMDASATGFAAEADSFLLGAYLSQRLGPVIASAQVAYAWTDWDVNRGASNAIYSSNELRSYGDIAYNLSAGKATFQPYAAFTWRVIDVDGFIETGGATPLAVAAQEDSVFSPELGLRFEYEGARMRPFASASYVFQGDIDTQATASFVALPGATFALQGTQPLDYARLTGGLAIDLGFGDLVLRGDALLGEEREATEFAGALRIPF